MRAFGSIAALAALAACGGAVDPPGETEAPARSAAGFHYDIRVDEGLSRLDATVCPEGALDRLVAQTVEASAHLLRAEIRPRSGAARPLQLDGRTLRVGGLADGDCVGYVVDLAEAGGGSWWAGAASDDVAIVDSTAWLWRPVPRSEATETTLRFELPDGVHASVPWPRDEGTYRLDESAFVFLAHTAFGRFDTEELRVGRSAIDVARVPGHLSVSDGELRAYVESAAKAVETMHGAMPVARIEVIVVPVGAGPDPVAFGHVGRGGGGSIVLLVRENAELPALRSDWVAVHELSHLAMPFVHREDAWISEGIATYYQEVLLARAGNQTPLDAWRALDHGFTTGRRDGSGDTLAVESRQMYRTRSFRRVYWGGAAFALDLDVALRRQGKSLDALMRGLGSVEADESWSAEQVLRTMDRLAGSDLPSQVARRHLAAREIPSFEELYASLGIERGQEGKLEIVGESAVREAITSPPRE